MRFPDRDHFGRIFFNQRAHVGGTDPQVAVVMAPARRAAHVPAMSDETIIVRGTGTIFLGGPPLVKAATGEEVTAEELGGADVHTRLSGVADYLAEDDEHALHLARTIVSTLNTAKRLPADVATPEPPAYDPQEIYGIVSADTRKPYEVREVIARIVDGSRFDEFKERYATTLVTGFARIHGFLVGIIANNGVLFSESALKATHFIELCNMRGVPPVFLQNITDSMVGRQHARRDRQDGAKMVRAVANSVVPKFTVVIGGSFGAGNYGSAAAPMSRGCCGCGRTRGSRSWGRAGRGGAHHRQADQLERGGKSLSRKRKPRFATRFEKYEREGSSYYSTARLGTMDSRSRGDARRRWRSVVCGVQCADSGERSSVCSACKGHEEYLRRRLITKVH